MPEFGTPRFTAEVTFNFHDLETAQEWLGSAEELGMKLNGDLDDSSIFDFEKMENVE